MSGCVAFALNIATSNMMIIGITASLVNKPNTTSIPQNNSAKMASAREMFDPVPRKL